MITQEFKERYAALYWGQKVAMIQGFESLITVDARLMEVSRVCKLRLRSLESITDEEAVEVARIWLGKTKGLGVHPETGKEYIKVYAKEQFKRVDCALIDYLRSRSIALPYLGVSVDEMVKEGFVELIKN